MKTPRRTAVLFVVLMALVIAGMGYFLTGALAPLPRPVPAPIVVHIGGDEHMVTVRLDNFVIGAFVDGTLCYGTYEPREAQCKHAIQLPEGL